MRIVHGRPHDERMADDHAPFGGLSRAARDEQDRLRHRTHERLLLGLLLLIIAAVWAAG